MSTMFPALNQTTSELPLDVVPNSLITEQSYENAIIQFFVSKLEYSTQYGPNIDRNEHSPLLEAELKSALERLNPNLPQAALKDAWYKLTNFEVGTLLQKNMTFTDYLQNGVPVKFVDQGEERSNLVYLIDYQHPDNNQFTLVNQWTVTEAATKRADLVLFVNGLPLVVMELKSPIREDTDASAAYRQLRNYMQDIPSLFIYNQICVISDLTTSKAGTITSGEDRFMEWKSKDGSSIENKAVSFEAFFEGIFTKQRFLDILQNFICFNVDGNQTYKILAGYHQYFAVRRAIVSTKHASAEGGNGKGGVFWHTQGSGKSLSMVFYAKLLQQELQSPTIIVITDRNDLDNQLFSQFSRCKDFLRQTPVQAKSRKDLQQRLNNLQVNGIFFTTMQKFTETEQALSERRNIIVIADEAHRSQYGLVEKVGTKLNAQGQLELVTSTGTARIIRNCLPNATYIGFTGTPISSKDRSTIEVFGNYIDVYDMTQAVADGATRPVFYESRVIHLKLDEEILQRIDAEYDIMASNTDPQVIEASKKKLGQMEAILGNEKTIKSLVDDILDHYENNRANLLTGKALIVAYSRPIAIKIYKRILELRPTWTEKIGVVMTQGNNDPEEWREIIGNKDYKAEMARKFKDNDSPLKIAIVVDMWLTGFDVPSLATMYVYKPMSGHNLMQAIARVNRVFKDKEGGLVVDYVGIAKALKQAMQDYTKRDQSSYGDPNIATTVLYKFKEKLEICRDLMHGFNYSLFFTGDDLQKVQLIPAGADFILGKTQSEADKPENEQTQAIFLKETQLLKHALSLCSSLANAQERAEAAYFEAVRTTLVRLLAKGSSTKLSLTEINARINELLSHSIQSDGVINLFAELSESFSLFDPQFLEEIANMEYKNLSVEMLKKLLAEQVSSLRSVNLVQSSKFSELLQKLLNKYINGMISNEEVIQELLKLAQEIKEANDVGSKNGLTKEELAFYDALTKPQAVVDFYTNDELVALTKELTDMLRKSRTVDWNKKESARSRMKLMVKKLLKKHKYPPESCEDAVQTVLQQCELWSLNQ